MLRLAQVLLLSRQNQGLREGIDAVEKEMASLHGVIETKDDAVQKLKRESDRLRRDIKRLHVRAVPRINVSVLRQAANFFSISA